MKEVQLVQCSGSFFPTFLLSFAILRSKSISSLKELKSIMCQTNPWTKAFLKLLREPKNIWQMNRKYIVEWQLDYLTGTGSL